MKKIILCAAFAAGFAAANAGTVENLTMPSKILGENKTLTVYLPDDYESTADAYPVLYLLHGAWGTDRDWTDKGSAHELADLAIKNGTAAPMIIVMPDARGINDDYAGPHMGYFNQPDWNYEDYFFQELIPYVENKYRVKTDKQHRAIAGLSMGGGGAVAYGQQYPEMFGAVCSLSGALGNFAVDSEGDSLNGSRGGMARYNQTGFVNAADEDAVNKLKSIRWFVDCGDDDFLALKNIDFFRAMIEKGIDLEYRMRDGAHNWTYWRTALPAVFQFVSYNFSE